MIRNQSGQRLWLKAFNASGYVEDDQANITCDLVIDGGVVVSLGNPTQAASKRGDYYYTPTAGQTDGHALKPLVESSTPGVQVVATPSVIYTIDAAPGYAIRIGDVGIKRHTNSSDTLDAIVLSGGVWSATGAIEGNNSDDPSKYVFAGLADNTAYEVRIRAGAEPAESDLAIAPIPVPVPVVSGGGGGTALTGPHAVTITVVDDETGDPLPGAKVRLYRPSAATQTEYTDVNGEYEFTVEEFVWLIAVTEGTHNGGSESIDVPNELAKVVRLTPKPSAPPSTDPSKSNVTARVISQSGYPVPDVLVTVKLKSKQVFSGSSLAINLELSGNTDENGEVTFELIRSIELSGNGLYSFDFFYQRTKHSFDHFVKDQPSDIATLRA